MPKRKGRKAFGLSLYLHSSSDSPVSEKPPFPPTPMGGRRLSERLVTLPRVPTAPFMSPAPFNVRPVSALHDETMPPFRRWRCAPHYTGGERPLGVGCDALLLSKLLHKHFTLSM